MRQTFYKKIKNRSINLFGDINALLKSIILFDDYNQLRLQWLVYFIETYNHAYIFQGGIIKNNNDNGNGNLNNI